MIAKDDGVTHINIYSKGQTLLGRLLSNFANTPFTHPEDGDFCSVEGYWYWLSCKDEKLRGLHGYEAKQFGRTCKGKDWCEDSEFKRKICLALKSKLEHNPGIATLLNKNTLPLKHYYVYGDKIIEPKEGQWIIDYLNSLKMPQ